MVMRVLTPEEVKEACLRSLGLDGTALDVFSPEGISAMVRIAASFLAPCSPRRIARLVSKCFQGLHAADDDVLPRILEMVDALTSYGDLLELREESEGGNSVSLVHLAPPSFVRRQSGLLFLIGIAPDGVSPFPETLLRRIEPVAYARRLEPQAGEDLASLLEGQGLWELPESMWLRAPRRVDLLSFVEDSSRRLERAVTSGEIAGLMVIDSEKPPTFYKGRWVEPDRLTGQFIGRREQRYGADLWSHVQLEDGNPVRLLDFASGEWRGSDQAWHLQMAMDAVRGKPQRYRVDEGDSSATAVLTFFSPLPSWACRRLDNIGEPVTAKRGLLAYRLPVNELAEERRVLETRLWLANESPPPASTRGGSVWR